MGFCGSGDFHVIRRHWSAIRAGQVSCGVKSTAAHHININKPNTTITFGAAGLKTPAAGGPCHPISTWVKHLWDPTGSPYTCIISSAGQIPHMIIGCNTHSGWRALACACIRHAKLLPLEVRRPSGKGPDQKQRFIWLPSETINNLSSSSVDMDAFDGCFSGKIKAFSTCKCWHTFDSHARLLDK